LCRTRSSGFDLGSAITLSRLEKAGKEDVRSWIISMSQALSVMPGILADPDLEQKVCHGKPLVNSDILPKISPGSCSPGPMRVVDRSDRLLAVIEPDKNGGKYNYCCVFAG
jgi:tRNA U55 pseudouridine synthase TruB